MNHPTSSNKVQGLPRVALFVVAVAALFLSAVIYNSSSNGGPFPNTSRTLVGSTPTYPVKLNENNPIFDIESAEHDKRDLLWHNGGIKGMSGYGMGGGYASKSGYGKWGSKKGGMKSHKGKGGYWKKIKGKGKNKGKGKGNYKYNPWKAKKDKKTDRGIWMNIYPSYLAPRPPTIPEMPTVLTPAPGGTVTRSPVANTLTLAPQPKVPPVPQPVVPPVPQPVVSPAPVAVNDTAMPAVNDTAMPTISPTAPPTLRNGTVPVRVSDYMLTYVTSNFEAEEPTDDDIEQLRLVTETFFNDYLLTAFEDSEAIYDDLDVLYNFDALLDQGENPDEYRISWDFVANFEEGDEEDLPSPNELSALLDAADFNAYLEEILNGTPFTDVTEIRRQTRIQLEDSFIAYSTAGLTESPTKETLDALMATTQEFFSAHLEDVFAGNSDNVYADLTVYEDYSLFEPFDTRFNLVVGLDMVSIFESADDTLTSTDVLNAMKLANFTTYILDFVRMVPSMETTTEVFFVNATMEEIEEWLPPPPP